MVQFTKLRISGFKSFVDPTDLLFEPGLTGVVGPNGCGKSNLVEALRWVMGETSPKSMRGGEMDDVIFAGSAKRPSRDIAEVAISLDNRRRIAPAQFNEHDELEVTRRIHRGSGSAYRVNGREVRARDVQMLFADAATGAHSPAMVGQGRVGALINAKPTERRALLEEAAGIAGLNTRRHEAELRLRAAETNLERLDDVVVTLEAQLQSLKKQARQAKRYRKIAEELRRKDALLLHIEAEAAKGGLEAARQALVRSEGEVTERSREAATRAKEQAQLAARLPGERQAEAEKAASLQRLLVERDNLTREAKRIEEAEAESRRRIGQIEMDLARARALAEDAAKAGEALAEERRSLQEATAGQEAERQESEARLAAVNKSLSNVEQRFADLSEELARTEAAASSLERRISDWESRNATLAKRKTELDDQRAKIRQKSIAGDDLAAAAQAAEEAQATFEALQKAGEQAAENLTEARRQEAEARKTLNSAEEAHTKLQAEADALSSLLDKGVSPDCSPVVDSVSVDPGYEAALGAALGDDLILPEDETAPLHWRSLTAYPDEPNLPNGSEALAAFVQAPASLARRLAFIGVVPDAETARRLQPDLGPGHRLVTRNGGLWRWDGLTVTPDAPMPAAQRLQQRNRLRKLRREVQAAAVALSEARECCTHAQARAEDAGEQEAQTRQGLQRSGQAVNDAAARLSALKQQQAAQESRLAASDEALARLEVDLMEARSALAEARTDSDSLSDSSESRARKEQLWKEVTSQRDQQAACRLAVDDLQRKAAARAERLRAIAEEIASWTRRSEQSKSHIADLDGRLESVAGELQALASRPAELHRHGEELAVQIEAAELARRQASDRLAISERQLGEADRAAKAAEAALASAREERVRSEASVSQCQHNLDNLSQRVREHLDCDMARVAEVAEIDPDQVLPERDQVEAKVARLTRERDAIGPVNLRAEQEARELEEKIAELERERADLLSAIARLRQGIASLNREGRERLLAAFEVVNEHFSKLFVRLFGGGRAHLRMTESEDPLDAGLEILASPPGKRLQVLSLLSGGEQALTALALLFAVFLTNPSPVCVLDEVDAPLDDANVDRFCTLVEEMAERMDTRFIIITHHRMTMARVDRLFGVTMAERGVSQLVSVDLEAAESLRESA